jgi:uncharacterized Fe-S cluster-containing radical SAM superfamily protein
VPLEGLEDPTILSRPPVELALCYDESCNLACPSCRTQRIMFTEGPEFERRRRFTDQILALLDEHAARHRMVLRVTGSGDPIASPIFRSLIERLDRTKHSKLELILQTNGVMLTEQVWRSLEQALPRVVWVWVSVDAAVEATYARIRKFGNWRQLQENLRFLSGLRATGAIQNLALNFVVQTQNFREMPAFVRMAEGIGNVDCTAFRMLLDWGTWSPDEFARQCVWDVRNPNYAELLEVLRAPELGHPIVDLGNLTEYRARALQSNRLVPTLPPSGPEAMTGPSEGPPGPTVRASKHDLLDHVQWLANAARSMGAELQVMGSSLQALIVRGGDRLVLHPRVLVTSEGGPVDPSAPGRRELFAGWMPAGGGWPAWADTRWFRPYAEAAKLPFPKQFLEAGAEVQDVVVRRGRLSRAAFAKGPLRSASEHRLDETQEECYEQFILGRLLTAWFWAGIPICCEVEPMPSVLGDGNSRTGDLIISRMVAKGMALGREAQEVLTRADRLQRHQGVALVDVPPRGVRRVVDFRSESPLALTSERVVVELGSAPDRGWVAVLREAGRRLIGAVPAELRSTSLFTIEATLDANGGIWLIDLQGDPVVHPLVYPAMLRGAVMKAGPPSS